MTATAKPRYTDEQILQGISAALEARDLEAVPGLLTLLALQNPEQAQVIYDAIVHGTYTVKIPLRGNSEEAP